MRILGIERDNTACSYYRVLQPLVKIDEQKLAEVFILKESQMAEPEAIQMALWADIIMFQRPATEAWFNFIKTCRKAGKIIVSDYDDDPFRTSPLNPFYQYTGTEEVEWTWPDGTKEMLWSESMVSQNGRKIFDIERNINHRDMFRLNFKKSDLITCTTEELRQDFLQINPNVTVLPNLVTPEFFPMNLDMVKRDVRLGWQGGASHYEDLYFLKDILKEVLTKNKNTKFVYFGDMRFTGLFKDCPQNQIEWHSWVNHSTYPYKLATLNIDIGLCPLVDNEFNRKKSAIKWMEYSLMNMATVASDIPPYSPVIESGRTGILCKEQSDWVLTLNELIKDKTKREILSSQAKDCVLENHNINTKAHLWVEAYDAILRPKAVA